ncbi:MAG: WecB/TagA/CpsF family glycosyltransferase [Pseudomonadota bacterium]
MTAPFALRVRSTEIAVNMPARDPLLAEVADRLRRGVGFALATINLDHLVKLRADPRFAEAYLDQDFVVADGNPVVWLSRLARRPVALVAGSDLVRPLAACAAEENASVALFGSTEETLAAAADALAREFPGLKIAIKIAPSQGFDPTGAEASDMLRRLGDSGASLTMIALGAPKQEIFAAFGRKELPSMGFVSVGAGLDFIGGGQRRAPQWMRRIAIEWLWRVAQNPRRLTVRYLKCIAILPGLAFNAIRS